MQKITLYKARWIAILFGALALALAVFIFCMSAEPAEVSKNRSAEIAGVLSPDASEDAKPLSKAEQVRRLSRADHILRKTAHFCIYALLGVLLCLTSLGFAARWYLHLLRTWLIGTVYAASDEIHQAFVPGRGPMLTDVLLDSAGVLAGVLFTLLFAHIIMKKKNRC